MDETGPAVVITAETVIESTDRYHDVRITTLFRGHKFRRASKCSDSGHRFRQLELPSYHMTALKGEARKEFMTVVLIKRSVCTDMDGGVVDFTYRRRVRLHGSVRKKL